MAVTLSEKEFEVAESCLADAKLLLHSGGSLRSAVNRIYYAVFHAAKAVLIRMKLEPKTHKGTIYLFINHIAKKGLCSKESAKMLSKAFKLREESDYDVFAPIDPEEVGKLLLQSEKFLREMKSILIGRV